MKTFKVMALMLAGLASANAASAQDNVEASIGADVVSTYVWRGQKLDDAAVQPTAGISYKGLSLSAWGSYGITASNPFNELDLTLAYTTGGFNIGITDFWNNAANTRYLLYDAHRTGHTWEANAGYDFGPVALQWYTIFAGFDGRTHEGKRAYTSYFELSAPFKLGGLDWSATVGAVPYNADGGYYPDEKGEGFAVTNVSLKATKELKITDSFSVPVYAQIATNPSMQKAYLVFGFTLQP